MEEDRSIRIVGNYSLYQAAPEDCIECKNAKYATVLIDGKCLDCLLSEREEINNG